MATDAIALEDAHSNIGSQTESAQLKNELLETIQKLCSTYGLFMRGSPRTASVAKLLASMPCERQIGYLLKSHSPHNQNQRFDPLYKLKSEYAVAKILDHLKTGLHSAGLRVSMATEAEYEFGVSDIQVTLLSPEGTKRNEVVRIEVKAGLGISLEQLERYLWSEPPLVVVRIMTRHVAVLRPNLLQGFVRDSMKEAVAKGKRLASGAFQEFPGTYCSECPDLGCSYNRYRQAATAMVKIHEGEFEQDLQSFFESIPIVAERVANALVTLLTEFDETASETSSP